MSKPKKTHSAKNPPAHIESDIIELQNQVNELTQALLRERADAINLRRRHDEEIVRLRTRLKASLIKELLPVIDNLERSLKHVPKDLENNAYVIGIQGVIKQFEKTLSDMGVERIKTLGQPFDPFAHEAVSMEEGDGSNEVVSEELQAGYKLNDEVIRPAMVKVKLQ